LDRNQPACGPSFLDPQGEQHDDMGRFVPLLWIAAISIGAAFAAGILLAAAAALGQLFQPL
jgi:hypothetical protein